MQEMGIWSNEAGGFISSGFVTQAEAEAELLVTDPDEMAEILPICPDHEEQPLYGCEECDDDTEEGS